MPFCTIFGQSEIYEPSPEYIRKNNIKRIVELINTAYHEEKEVLPDTTRIRRFNEDGFEIYSVGFLQNVRSVIKKITRDENNRIIRNERFDGDKLESTVEYNYLPLPSGDYIVRSSKSEEPRKVQFYKYEFDSLGNEICREYWNEDSAVINWDSKTYNDHSKIVSRIHQVRAEDTIARTVSFYKNDTILVKKKLFSKGELSMLTKYEYYPNGQEKVVHFGKQSSWYSEYDSNNRLVKKVIVRYDAKDTLIKKYEYNEHGLMSALRNDRKKVQERREVFTYEDGKEQTKMLYVRGDQPNTFYETVYLGDTARIIYQTPHWKNKAFYAVYHRIDKHGNVLEERGAQVRGMKQPIRRILEDTESTRYQYELSETGKVLAKYRRYTGWSAEECLCRDYSDHRIVEGLSRRIKRRKNVSCDTIRTQRHNGGIHFTLSMNATPKLKRHIYQNKNGVVDSILDVNKSGAILNRMVKENDVRISYTLLNRYEYNEFDSVRRVYQCFGTRNYSYSEYMTEEHFWNGNKKVKELKFYDNWKRYSRDDTTLVTYRYQDDFVFRTTKDRLGKITEHRLKYDANNRLIERVELDRQSGTNRETHFTYDEDGNLLEKSTVLISTPIETLVRYEFY